MRRADELKIVEEYFHKKIPLTRAMGVRVIEHPGGSFAVEAPVLPNHNHLDTAFGGSINAVATLAGYGLLWIELRGDSRIHVVVAESSIRFLRPVRETIRATCTPPSEAEWSSFKTALATTGKARLTVQVLVEEGGALAARFTGVFMACQE